MTVERALGKVAACTRPDTAAALGQYGLLQRRARLGSRSPRLGNLELLDVTRRGLPASLDLGNGMVRGGRTEEHVSSLPFVVVIVYTDVNTAGKIV